MSATQRDEAIRFLDSLKGAPDEVIDTISAQAMQWATFYKDRGYDLYNMELWIHSNTMFPAQIVSTIKSLQKQGTPASSVGLQVWLHSARALLYPELRRFGREIWGELVKASPEAEAFSEELHQAINLDPSFIDRTRVPLGLEELDR